MADKSPLRVGLEDYLKAHGPSTIEELVDKVGRKFISAPVAVRERRSHLSANSKTRSEVTPNVEVLVGTRSLIQKMLWSCMKGRVTVRKNGAGLYEYVPQEERSRPYRPASTWYEGEEHPNSGPRRLIEQLQKDLRDRLDKLPVNDDRFDNDERQALRQTLFFADKVASSWGEVRKVKMRRRDARRREKLKQEAAAKAKSSPRKLGIRTEA